MIFLASKRVSFEFNTMRNVRTEREHSDAIHCCECSGLFHFTTSVGWSNNRKREIYWNVAMQNVDVGVAWMDQHKPKDYCAICGGGEKKWVINEKIKSRLRM